MRDMSEKSGKVVQWLPPFRQPQSRDDRDTEQLSGRKLPRTGFLDMVSTPTSSDTSLKPSRAPWVGVAAVLLLVCLLRANVVSAKGSLCSRALPRAVLEHG